VRRIEHPRAAESITVADDATYQDACQSFLDRLNGERARLAVLEAALAIAAEDQVTPFLDLEIFAHRLRGAAAVFDLPELREDSKVLELAAGKAVLRHAPINDPQVRAAIRLLKAQLIHVNRGKPSAADAVALFPAN
jgi:HPt (histidine-containing phosphotransfer) domain-containing protein